jgi:hypothetical protein
LPNSNEVGTDKPTATKKKSKKKKRTPAPENRRKNRLTPRTFHISKLKLERKKGVVVKKTNVIPHAFAAQQTVYFQSLFDTIFSSKIDAALVNLMTKEDVNDNLGRLMKVEGSDGPRLFWAAGTLGIVEDATYKGRNITPSNLAHAIREDPLVKKHFESIEIPFGGSSVKSVPLTQKKLKQVSEERRMPKEIESEDDSDQHLPSNDDGNDGDEEDNARTEAVVRKPTTKRKGGAEGGESAKKAISKSNKKRKVKA